MSNFAELISLLPVVENPTSQFSSALEGERLEELLKLQNRIYHAQGFRADQATIYTVRHGWSQALLQRDVFFQAGIPWEGLTLDLARTLSAHAMGGSFVPIPNREGGVTAIIQSYIAVNANTPNLALAGELIELLLSDEAQKTGFPNSGSSLNSFPVVKGKLEEYLLNLAYPSQYDMEELELAPLSPQTIDTFLRAEEKITNFAMIDDRAIGLYKLCLPYFQGECTLQ